MKFVRGNGNRRRAFIGGVVHATTGSDHHGRGVELFFVSFDAGTERNKKHPLLPVTVRC
jgi:hypothetical protein